MIQSSLEQKLEIVANRKMLMNIQERMDIIETELKHVASADALDMDKLAGLDVTVQTPTLSQISVAIMKKSSKVHLQ